MIYYGGMQKQLRHYSDPDDRQNRTKRNKMRSIHLVVCLQNVLKSRVAEHSLFVMGDSTSHLLREAMWRASAGSAPRRLGVATCIIWRVTRESKCWSCINLVPEELILHTFAICIGINFHDIQYFKLKLHTQVLRSGDVVEHFMMISPNATFFAKYRDDLYSHMIGVNIYTPLCFFFPLEDASDKAAIIEKLTKGSEKLSASFPWLTGQVIRAAASLDGRPSSYRVAPFEKTCGLIVKDNSDDSSVPSLADLRKARFPCRMIDGETFTSLTGVPNSREGEPTPIFFIQVNFLKDGLVLSFAGEHSLMDGHGTGQVIRLFSKACSGAEEITDEEVSEGNRTSEGMIELLPEDTFKPGAELDFLVERPQIPGQATDDGTLPKCSWAYVRFSSTDIAQLKDISSASASDVNKSSTAAYITSNDAITAFIWKSVSRARTNRLPSDVSTTIGRAVDARSSLNTSSAYIGNMSNHTYTTKSLADVADAPLDQLASTLRSALQPADIAYGIQSLATHVSRSSDRSQIHYGANMDFSRDIFLSSWARLPSYDHEFGLGLGAPEAVRRPGFLAIEGLLYLLPMDRQNNVEAMICLRDEDLEQLRADKDFSAFSDWIG